MTDDQPGVFAWCELCQHFHRTGSPCLTECEYCEYLLVIDVEVFLGIEDRTW